MHSRKLVHGDIGPCNIHCTSDGLAKLIDFGAMTPMGSCKQVIGTVPFIAPEVLNIQTLDGRTDLYSLGATLYFALTGCNAYPAKDFRQLRERWGTTPKSPSEYIESIPDVLEKLVISLIQLDPDLRPTNVFEVMERLSAIAGIKLNEQLLVTQAYLSTPTLVGRNWQTRLFLKQVSRIQRGVGDTVVIHGKKGVGRSRFINSCGLEGKFLGLNVIRSDTSDAFQGDFSVIRKLSYQLITLMKSKATEAAKSRVDILGHILPELGNLFSGVSLKTFDSENFFRSEVQNAFIEWICEISRTHPLILLIDDFDLIDEPSAALLTLLSYRLINHSIILLVSIESKTLLQVGQVEQAQKMGREALQKAEEAGLGYVRNYLRIPFSLAEARMGEYTAAVEVAQAAIAEMESLNAGGIHLGVAYEVRARVAIIMKDSTSFQKYERLCAREYSNKGNAALTVKYERLITDALQPETTIAINHGFLFDPKSPSLWQVAQSLRQKMESCHDSNDRAIRVLTMLIERCGTNQRIMYLIKEDGPRLCAQIGECGNSRELDSAVRNYISTELDQFSEDVTVTHFEQETSHGPSVFWTESNGVQYRSILLGHHIGEGFVLTGVVVLPVEKVEGFSIPSELLLAISKYLHDCGDVTTNIVAY